jgi:hypothetical protein
MIGGASGVEWWRDGWMLVGVVEVCSDEDKYN